MVSNKNKQKNTIFLVLFLILTVLCWCPIGYGSYGEVELIMGMPSWAFTMLIIGAILFVIEWIYLFRTDLALYDENLEEIVEALKAVDKKQTVIKED